MLSADVPTGEPESSGGDGFEDDPTGDNCPLSDGLISFVLEKKYILHLIRLSTTYYTNHTVYINGLVL